MIEVTILNAQELARDQIGARAAQAGVLGGADIERTVRNQMADRMREQFANQGIDATVETDGSRRLEITINDAADAAWKQGILAWLVAKVMPSSVEHTFAPSVRDNLEESGIEAEVEVT